MKRKTKEEKEAVKKWHQEHIRAIYKNAYAPGMRRYLTKAASTDEEGEPLMSTDHALRTGGALGDGSRWKPKRKPI